MATSADYVGKNCPYCGAVDSIETDDARGEAACTECATVIAMGLEESTATRWEKEMTYFDADWDKTAEDGANSGGAMGRAKAKNAGLTREEAAAAAAGLLRRAPTSADAFDPARYDRTRLHPAQARTIETLFRLSRRNDDAILHRATSLARVFVGYRRERSVRVEHQTEVAAACLMLASEMEGQPIPLAELRVLDPALRDVESRRHDIITETKLGADMARVEKKFVPNLIHYYLMLLQLPLVYYEQPCLALFQAIRNCELKSATGVSELALLVEAEKVVMAVLLARTESSLHWPKKPPGPADPSSEPPAATLHSSFAAKAHLQPQRVQKIMRVADKALPLLVAEFDRLMVLPEFATGVVRAVGEAVVAGVAPKKEDTAVAAGGDAVKKEGSVIGMKRSRSSSPPPPSLPQ